METVDMLFSFVEGLTDEYDSTEYSIIKTKKRYIVEEQKYDDFLEMYDLEADDEVKLEFNGEKVVFVCYEESKDFLLEAYNNFIKNFN
jgi:hypothetical protein|nr:MAG TPA: hypothetical protein [Caudoviricetes sp.]